MLDSAPPSLYDVGLTRPDMMNMVHMDVWPCHAALRRPNAILHKKRENCTNLHEPIGPIHINSLDFIAYFVIALLHFHFISSFCDTVCVLFCFQVSRLSSSELRVITGTIGPSAWRCLVHCHGFLQKDTLSTEKSEVFNLFATCFNYLKQQKELSQLINLNMETKWNKVPRFGRNPWRKKCVSLISRLVAITALAKAENKWPGVRCLSIFLCLFWVLESLKMLKMLKMGMSELLNL